MTATMRWAGPRDKTQAQLQQQWNEQKCMACGASEQLMIEDAASMYGARLPHVANAVTAVCWNCAESEGLV